ncbi:cation/H(+) antiporter 15-like [Populus alba x Populus x berolinensis]|uniref:Cation/H(+) antiporter 15-like n=1 Tax=Populus alba x Populus x berolinensis TaxID=444605 RepID=A0AAD6R397_9ROSI|nr:cation/H(+) antiporter 15-like [Populus alba x Populus x berolinensis]
MDLNELQNFYHVRNASNKPCFVVNITAEHGIWQSENPLTQSLPLLAMQLAATIFVTRAVYYLLRPLAVPRIVTDFLGGVLMGPSALSLFPKFRDMFPLRSIVTVETVAYWALCCHLFLIGLEFDMSVIENLTRTSKKAIHIAIAGVLIPFIMGIGLFFFMNQVPGGEYNPTGCVYIGLSLAVTGYPIVARVLNDVKLLHSDIGRMAMSASLVTDLISWILVIIGIAFSNQTSGGASVAVLSTVGFALFCIFVVRPALAIIISKTSKENDYSENYLCFVLVAISAFAVVTDILGTNSVVGAFIFGFIMPNRILAAAFLDKFEDFVTGYLLPLFFTICGIRIDIWSLFDKKAHLAIGSVVVFLNKRDYTVMAIAILLMTGVVAPVTASIYRPAKHLSNYKRRTIQKGRQGGELRILACFQNFRNVSGMISLIDSSNATRESPLNVFALHVLELTGRASAMLIVHSTGGKSSGYSRHGRKNSQSEKIVTALETYQTLNDNVNIHALTSMSPHASMHEDICSLAEEKHTALLVIPFHKLPSKDGKLEAEDNTSFRGVNLNVLANAPCSVGIFVDRGFGVSDNGESSLTMRQILMLFVGGPDDREALAYAWRMGGTEGISLTVVRFLPGDQVEEIQPKDLLPVGEAHKMLTSITYVDSNRKLDDEYVNEFRLKTAGEQFVSYQERVVNNDEEIVLALQEMHHTYDLYVVGRGEGIVSPLTESLADWCEYPELGPLGDLLITSSFAQGSVLVVQQYVGSKDGISIADMLSADNSTSHGSHHFSSWEHSSLEDGGLEMEPFAHHKGKQDVDA